MLLRIIWREKARQRGEDRQLRRTRTDYLNQWSFVLIPLVVLLLCMISLAAVHPQTVVVVLLLTAFACAAGSTLGGVLRLRDLPELTNIRNLKNRHSCSATCRRRRSFVPFPTPGKSHRSVARR